jgi:hypothetical protein
LVSNMDFLIGTQGKEARCRAYGGEQRLVQEGSQGKFTTTRPIGLLADANPPSQNPLIEKRTRNFGIGQDIQPTRNLSRMVKWPEYVRLQRQRKILQM